MFYLLDTADLKSIERAFDLYPVSGVTTNPTIISREKREFLEILKDIRGIIGMDSMLHIQAISQRADEIIREAEYLNEKIGGNLYVKIPVVPEGIKAMKLLAGSGIKTTATAIFTPQQALMAASTGAEFVAPYINRLDNIGGDGPNIVSEIIQLFDLNRLETKVLAASFKNVEQVHRVMLSGAQSVTVALDIMEQLLYHPLTDLSVKQFVCDWEGAYGKGSTTCTAI